MLKLGELVAVIKTDDKPMEKGLDKSQGRFAAFGKMLVAGAAAIALAAAAALGTGIAKGLDFEKANSKLAAQLGATPAEAARLGKVAGDLYAGAWGDSMGQVNEAIESVVSSVDGMRDASNEAVKDTTGKVLSLAEAFELDTARAAQIAGQAVRSGLVADVNQGLDLITVSLQKVPKAVREDLLDALDEYSPFLTSIGIKGERAFELLVKGAEKGMYGIDKTGDALKEFTIRATDMSTASKVGFDLLGMSQEKMSRRLLKGGEDGAKAFDQIIAGLLKIKDPVKQSQAALALFGTPLEDLSVTEIPKFLTSLQHTSGALGDVEGASKRLGDTLSDNAATKIEKFKRSAEMKLTELGGGIIKVFERVAAKPEVKEFLGEAQKFVQDKVIPALQRLHGWFDQKIAPVLQKLADDYIKKAKDAWHDLEQAVHDNEPQLRQFAGWMEKIADFVLHKVVPAVGPAFTGSLAGTITMIKTGIGWISGMVTAWNAVKGAVSGAADWTHQKVDDLVGFFKGLPARMRSATAGMFDGMKSAFRSAVNWLIAKWNDFHLTLGGGSIMGMDIPSVTLSTPNIPMLAHGGHIMRPGRAIVGDAGPEVLDLPAGATVRPLSGGGSLGEVRIVGELRVRGSDLVLILRDQVELRSGGNVQDALGTPQFGM